MTKGYILIRVWLGIAVLLFLPAILFASDNRILLTILQDVEVNTDEIRLGDIAQITFRNDDDQELAEKLSNVSLGKSPALNIIKQISGDTVLQAIAKIGISQDDIGYTMPRLINVKRVKVRVDDEVVVRQQTKQDFLIKKGDQIKVAYNFGALSVVLNGIALDSANIGDVLMVKNAKSQKVIKTRVVNADLAEVVE